MKRRDVLGSLAAAGTLTLTAGCLADGSPSDEPTDTDQATDSPTQTPTGGEDTPTGTSTDGGEHVDTEAGTTRPPSRSDTPDAGPAGALTVTGSGCGTETDDASITFDDTAVAITGTIWGNDACYTATLAETRQDDGTLTVVVASVSDAGTDTMCAPCTTEIDYEADVAFDGDLPDSVEVRHRHGGSTSTVATADR